MQPRSDTTTFEEVDRELPIPHDAKVAHNYLGVESGVAGAKLIGNRKASDVRVYCDDDDAEPG